MGRKQNSPFNRSRGKRWKPRPDDDKLPLPKDFEVPWWRAMRENA